MTCSTVSYTSLNYDYERQNEVNFVEYRRHSIYESEMHYRPIRYFYDFLDRLFVRFRHLHSSIQVWQGTQVPSFYQTLIYLQKLAGEFHPISVFCLQGLVKQAYCLAFCQPFTFSFHVELAKTLLLFYARFQEVQVLEGHSLWSLFARHQLKHCSRSVQADA